MLQILSNTQGTRETNKEPSNYMQQNFTTTKHQSKKQYM